MNKKKISALILSCAISSQVILPTLNASASELNNTNNKTIEKSTSNLKSVNSNENFKENKNQEITGNLTKEQNIENKSNQSIKKNLIQNTTNKTKTTKNPKLIIDGVVHIPSLGLKAALNKELGQEYNSDITKEQLESIKKLEVPTKGIKNISGLEYCINLTYLDLHRNEIEDIEPLRNLTNLTYLNLSTNKINNIEPLKNLINLSELDLENNKINDIRSLENLTNLSTLNLGINQINNVSFLVNLTNLNNLNLYNNNLNNIEPLKELTKLKNLNLRNNKISNIRSLENLLNLRTLYLSNNQIQNINPLKNSVNLLELDLENNKINDISSLENLINLSELNLGNNNIKNINSLINLVNLSNLNLYNNQIIQIDSLSNLTNLNNLNLSNNQIINISPLNKITNLLSLSLDNQKILSNPIYSTNGNAETSNIIKGINNEFITPTSISDNGIYDKTSNNIKWNNLNMVNEVNYSFDHIVTIGNVSTLFSGDVSMNVINGINEKPVIHAENKTIKVGSKFNLMDGVSATDKEDGNITNKIRVVESTVNLSKPGTYKVVYEVTDSHDEKTRKTITVTVVSNDKPVINGIVNITIKEGTVFNPMTGVTATDTEDGNLTNNVKVTGNIDTNKPGKYELIYTVADTAGNTITVKRVITVITNTENINKKPVIHAENKTIKVGSKFNLMDGVSATDKEDGNITNKIRVVESTVNLSKPGTYKVVYEVTDSHDKKTRKTITVTVVSNDKPISNESNNLTNTNKPTTNNSTTSANESTSSSNSSNDNVTLPATGATSSLPLIGSILVGLGGLFTFKKKN